MTEEKVEVTLGNSKAEVLGLRLGDLAVTPAIGVPDLWTITHLPSGCVFGAYYFEEKAKAVAAMEELCTVQNSWDISYQRMLEKRERILEVLTKHGGIYNSDPRNSVTTSDYKSNGYSGDPL